MTTNEYLLNAAFVLLVLRQARERELDRRSVIVPLILMFFVGAQYLRSFPTVGNDLVLIVVLATRRFDARRSRRSRHARSHRRQRRRARPGGLDRGRPVGGRNRRADGIRVRGRSRFRVVSPQFQHRASAHRGSVADGARADGAARSRRADRRRPGSRPPARRCVNSPGQRISPRPVSAGRTAFYRLPVDTPQSVREAEARGARRSAPPPPARHLTPARPRRHRRCRDRRDHRTPGARGAR